METTIFVKFENFLGPTLVKSTCPILDTVCPSRRALASSLCCTGRSRPVPSNKCDETVATHLVNLKKLCTISLPRPSHPEMTKNRKRN